MLDIAEMLPPHPSPLWQLVKQCGVNKVVGLLDYPEAGRSWSETHGVGPAPDRSSGAEPPWAYSALAELKDRYAAAGFELSAIEASPPMDNVRLGLPGRDEQIADLCDYVRNMGQAGIHVWCYNWMAGHSWGRTAFDLPARGGALVTGYDHAQMKNEPLTEAGLVDEDRLWESLEYFLVRVVPVAEAAGVQMAMHPDDPPLSPVRGVGRIMRSLENYQRLIDLVPSPANGITFCQGNFALMTDDLPAAIRHFGRQGKIHYVHFRDVRGTPENFVETFHDDGPTDMLACLRAYRDIGFEGVLRPDHVPTMEGELNDNPGYGSLGRLFAIGYIKGLLEAGRSN